MKIELTEDSPILLKIIPETSQEVFSNGIITGKLIKMKIVHKIKENGTILLNIDPDGWKDFTEHGIENK